MNIADRTEAARMGWETRRKRQAMTEEALRELEIKTLGVEKIKVWRSFFIKMNPDLFKPWVGAPPMGHDSGPPSVIIRGKKDHRELIPADYFTVERYRGTFGFDGVGGAKKLIVCGTTVHANQADKILSRVTQLQAYLGSI